MRFTFYYDYKQTKTLVGLLEILNPSLAHILPMNCINPFVGVLNPIVVVLHEVDVL